MKARWETSGPSPFGGLALVVDSAAMKPEPSIFDAPNEDADEAAAREGEDDLAHGRVISHDAMKAWLLSWGTPDELPPPAVGD